jgi:hypothetical protein
LGYKSVSARSFLFGGEEFAGELPVFGAEPSLEFFGVDLF